MTSPAKILARTLALLVLVACAPVTEPANRRDTGIELPPMRVFSGPVTARTTRSNASIARDFLDLSFSLESGRPLPVLTRFEAPITVRVTGEAPPSMITDLDRLIERFRREAGIDIRRTGADEPASITIETVPRRELQRAVPQAACFVVPRVTGWADFKRNRRTAQTDWTTLKVREKLSVFMPSDVPPQEIRDCLHEELAQALGPLNDMYHLSDSVFNDDNFHTVLTGFDMLILRTTYAPELQSGMSREEVARRLPALLNRLNPGGRGGSDTPRPVTSREWINEIETALGARTVLSRRQAAAKRAVTLARAGNWNDNRLAFSLFALGRLSLGREPALALSSFLQAGAIYAADPLTAVHAAHVAMQLAAFSLSGGQAEVAIKIVDANVPAVRQAENAALLASLLLVKVEALLLLGRTAEAAELQRESLGWARYGFGPDDEVRKRASEIGALNPLRRGHAS